MDRDNQGHVNAVEALRLAKKLLNSSCHCSCTIPGNPESPELRVKLRNRASYIRYCCVAPMPNILYFIDNDLSTCQVQATFSQNSIIMSGCKIKSADNAKNITDLCDICTVWM